VAARLDVVQDASSRLGDLELGTITNVTDAGTFQDSTRTEPDGHWNDAWISINGVERRVTQYQKPGFFETNEFPVTPVPGDGYELRKDQLHTRAQVVNFANAAVRDVQFSVWVLVDSYLDNLTTSLTVDGVYAYPVPPEMECVYEVLYQLPLSYNDANWYPVAPQQWFVNEPEQITFYDRPPPEGSKLRFLGTRRPYQMVFEDDLCEVEPSFVSVFAAKLIALRMMKGSDGERFKTLYAGLREEEQAIRKTMRIRQPNNIRRVRPTGTGATSGHAPVPLVKSRAAMWYVGEGPPNYTIGRPGDLYLQANGVVWQYLLPGGWTATTTDISGPAGAAGPIGPPGMVWRGTWQASSQYLVDDGVHYEGSAYICIADVPAGGGQPAPPYDLGVHWDELALEGDPGPSGPATQHEEFLPPASATTVSLSLPLAKVVTVSRAGVTQSQTDGHYSVAGQLLTFSTPFTGTERIVVTYQ
jgi:hypothetical protein